MSDIGPEAGFDFKALEAELADLPTAEDIVREDRDYNAYGIAMIDVIGADRELFAVFAHTVREAGWQEVRIVPRTGDQPS